MEDQHKAPEASEIAAGMEEKMAELEQVVTAALKQGTALIRKHPVESMIAGFGLGCLIGALLTRRN